MKKSMFLTLISGLLIALVFGGCQKKATKIPDATAAPAVEQPQESQINEGAKEQESAETSKKESTAPKIELAFKTVYFDYDKSDIRSDARDALAQNAKVMKAYPNTRVLIEGNCDERGTIEYNLALGEKRAYAVKNYLVNYGIDEGRISTISYGEERPVDTGHTPEAWSKNRRADFKIVGR
ncbi:MAG: peptidoglycan-associated lipoprotein Pal [Calditrichia bacterium]